MRPNLVFVLVDQLRLQSCGYAGDPRARTPTLDRLAKSGMSFNNAVSTSPVCGAYRASLMTGKYASTTGMVINEMRTNPNHVCLGHCLTRSGYDTAYIGKWHLWSNQTDNPLSFENGFVPAGPARLGFDGYWAAYHFNFDYFHANYFLDDSSRLVADRYETRYLKVADNLDEQAVAAIEKLSYWSPVQNATVKFPGIGFTSASCSA